MALVVNRSDLFDMFGAVEAFDVDPRNAKIALTTVQGVFEPPPKDGADNALEAGPRIRAEQEPCADRVRQPCSDLAAKLQLPDARDQSLIVRTTEEVGRSLTVGRTPIGWALPFDASSIPQNAASKSKERPTRAALAVVVLVLCAIRPCARGPRPWQ